MTTVAIIPARMAATRFPGKPMAKIKGIPMIGHCYLRTALTLGRDRTYVATCDEEIFDYIKSINGNCVMTSGHHERASDRCAEAVPFIEKDLGADADLIAMIQGDEPLVTSQMIEKGLAPFHYDNAVEIVNLMTATTPERYSDANEVKVVFDLNKDALYFSREPIPSSRKYTGQARLFRQLGMIFFRRDTLLEYSQLEPTELEIIESVDMNRLLEYGKRIRMVDVDCLAIGVDVPGDLVRAEVLMETDKTYKTYQARSTDILRETSK